MLVAQALLGRVRIRFFVLAATATEHPHKPSGTEPQPGASVRWAQAAGPRMQGWWTGILTGSNRLPSPLCRSYLGFLWSPMVAGRPNGPARGSCRAQPGTLPPQAWRTLGTRRASRHVPWPSTCPRDAQSAPDYSVCVSYTLRDPDPWGLRCLAVPLSPRRLGPLYPRQKA